MDELIAFLDARLDEDEAAANGLFFACRMSGPLRFVSGYGGPAADAFIARHDPARVLRDVAAARAIIKLHLDAYDARFDDDQWNSGHASAMEGVFKQLAAIWNGHPGYRPEWKP